MKYYPWFLWNNYCIEVLKISIFIELFTKQGLFIVQVSSHPKSVVLEGGVSPLIIPWLSHSGGAAAPLIAFLALLRRG